MATTFSSTTLSGNYNDDYNADDNYHQILFKSGRSLQARELTQLQTMVYKEMGRFGNNIFKEGSAVTAGGMSVNSSFEYVKIASTNQGGNFADIPVGSIFTDGTTGIKATVLRVEPLDTANGFDFDTLYVAYIAAGAQTGDSLSTTPTRFGDNITLTQDNGSYEIVTHSPRAVGRGTRFDVDAGDFFVMGRFVQANAQSLVLSPYTESYTGTIGYRVVQEVLTVNDDADLYDNSGENLNTASPGADRYRIRLELVEESAILNDETFVFLARIENSTVVEKAEETDAYNKINDLLAMRTKEESGNYIVEPFVVNIDSSTATSLDLTISSGTAYVNGYRVDNPSTTVLNIPRPQETDTVTNDVVPLEYGNYFLVDSARVDDGAGNLGTLDYAAVNLNSGGFGAGSGDIGSARVRAIEEDGTNWKVYVFDVQINDGQSIHDVRSIGSGSTNYFGVVTEGEKAHLYDTTNNDLLMPTSRPRPESFTDMTITVQRSVTDTAAAGQIDISAELGAGESFVDTSLWTIVGPGTDFVTNADFSSIGSGIVAGLSNVEHTIYYYVQKTATRRSKTLTDATGTFTKQISGGLSFFDLGVPDIYQVDSVRLTNSAGIDISNVVTLDDGQQDNFYADGRLILDSAVGLDVSTAYVAYKHWSRGATGDFYTAQSYNVPYKDIPTHTLQDGTEVNLRNYVDFRPDENTGTYSNIHRLPRVGTNLTADISYYLPRADKLLVTQEGDIQLLMGQQSERPQYKSTPNDSLELYKILLNANTLDEDDLQVTPIEHKRYTMKDIAELENKLDGHIEYTQLSLLELEQKLTAALDSAGNARLESGSQVDDFSDQSGSSTDNPGYSASLDPESKLIRPRVDEDNIRLIIDNTLTTSGVVQKGDNVYVAYDSAEWLNQDLATRTVNVNPFGNIDNVGTLKLSPTTDEWKESKEEASQAIGGARRLDRIQAFLWNNWTWNWSGRAIDDIEQAEAILSSNPAVKGRKFLRLREKYNSYLKSNAPKYGNGRFVSRVVTTDTLRRRVGNRVVDLALIPWIRSRRVYFKAQGLKPNTKFTPFFDGVDMTSWVREETSFVKFSDRTDDNGNKFTYSTLTEHPFGKSDLISDANGELIGSLWIPNIAPQYYVRRVNGRGRRRTYGLRFRAGIREFKLLDISENNWAAADSKAFAYYSVFGALPNRLGTTRPMQTTWPLPWGNPRFPSTFTPVELGNVLNNVAAATVDGNYVEPHPAGEYGPGTVPLGLADLTTYANDGTMSQVISDYVSKNQQQYKGVAVNTLSMPQNPLAQTFYVDNQFGLTLTKIDLFFAEKPANSNLPVSIHIRPVENGAPSASEIVPDSHVYVNAASVATTTTSSTLSQIQAAPTSFVFEEPIYLAPWTQYAIVVTSQSTEYKIYSAKATEPVFGSTQRIMASKYSGNLFLPQNGLAWTPAKNQDLMMKVTRAQFNVSGGSLILKNANLPPQQLESNPIRTENGSNTVTVTHPCHGLAVGDEAFIDSVDAVGGITATNLRGSRIVTAVDLNSYQYSAGDSASSDAVGGGNKVLSRRNRNFTVTQPHIETSIPNFTSIDVSAKFTTGNYVAGSATRFTQDAEYIRITPKQNVDFDAPRAVYNLEAETNDLAGNASVYVKIDMKTSNNYVSPVVDLQRASLHMITECITDPSVITPINNVSEEDAYCNTGGMRHITTPVTLENDAVGIEAKVDVSLPEGAGIQMWYRTATADQNILDQQWVRRFPENNIANVNDGSLIEARFLPGGQGGYLQPFNQVQQKFVMTGTNAGPAMTNLRLRYLSV